MQMPHIYGILVADPATRSRCSCWRIHVAVLKGTDVDQPRNLAKSVTVE